MQLRSQKVASPCVLGVTVMLSYPVSRYVYIPGVMLRFPANFVNMQAAERRNWACKLMRNAEPLDGGSKALTSLESRRERKGSDSATFPLSSCSKSGGWGGLPN